MSNPGLSWRWVVLVMALGAFLVAVDAMAPTAYSPPFPRREDGPRCHAGAVSLRDPVCEIIMGWGPYRIAPPFWCDAPPPPCWALIVAGDEYCGRAVSR